MNQSGLLPFTVSRDTMYVCHRLVGTAQQTLSTLDLWTDPIMAATLLATWMDRMGCHQ